MTMPTDDATPERIVDAALSFLEAKADEWANEVGLQRMVDAAASAAGPHKNKVASIVDALVSQAFIEGAYRGYQEALRAQPPAPPTDPATAYAHRVTIPYRNYRGEFAQREIAPIRLFWGFNEWHPEPPQWLIEAWDIGKSAIRTFALAGIGQPPASPPGDAVRVPGLMPPGVDGVYSDFASGWNACRDGLIACGVSTQPDQDAIRAAIQEALWVNVGHSPGLVDSIIRRLMDIGALRDGSQPSLPPRSPAMTNAKDVLRQIEWGVWYHEDGVPFCPCCRGYRPDSAIAFSGHAPDCRLAAALASPEPDVGAREGWKLVPVEETPDMRDAVKPTEHRQEVLTVDRGQIVIAFPVDLSPSDLDDFEEHLRLFMRRLRRIAAGRAALARSAEMEGERNG